MARTDPSGGDIKAVLWVGLFNLYVDANAFPRLPFHEIFHFENDSGIIGLRILTLNREDTF